MVYSRGLMVPNTKATGERIKLMERELSGMYTETNSKVTGKTIKLTGTVFTLIATAHVMKEIGNTICNMDGV